LKKILLVGSDQVWSLERIYLKYLKQGGVETELFPAQSIFYQYYRGLLKKILFRTGFSGIYRSINQQLIEKVRVFRPEIVWVFKGMEIFPNTLRELSAMGCTLANYNPDNPFLFSGAGSGNKNITDSLPLYDLHFSYSFSIKSMLESLGHSAQLLPFGYEVSEDLYKQTRAQQEVIKTCFLGNPDKDRAAILMQLAGLGIAIDVYGHGWDKFVNHSSITIHDAVYSDDFWKVLGKYRVQLNIMRPHNLDSHNMRSFEIPAIGGIQVAPDTPEHREYFIPGKEIFLFNAAADCAALIRSLLAMSKAEAEAIRNAARQRSVNDHYSYRDRALQANSSLQNISETMPVL
jgi:spore maturation protein CgeB